MNRSIAISANPGGVPVIVPVHSPVITESESAQLLELLTRHPKVRVVNHFVWRDEEDVVVHLDAPDIYASEDMRPPVPIAVDEGVAGKAVPAQAAHVARLVVRADTVRVSRSRRKTYIRAYEVVLRFITRHDEESAVTTVTGDMRLPNPIFEGAAP